MRVHTVPDLSTVRGLVAGHVRAELGRNMLSVNRLPRLLGKSQSYWSRRVNADQPMDVDDLAALASLLKVPVSRFFGAVDSENPHPAVPDGGLEEVRREGIEPPTRCVRTSRPLVVDELASRRAARKAAAPAYLPATATPEAA
jgi:transcriptional regulator with XRE-family HTH domain